MFRKLTHWLNDRTGCSEAIREVLYKRIPGGARWRYVWGTTLAFSVFIEFVTGLFLWMHYSPSTQTAWESVYYIEHEMQGGSLLRGIHHYTAHVLMILLALHLMQIVIAGAYRAPREVNHWVGLGIMASILVLGQTGYLLPWDQRGLRGTQIATTIAGAAPMVGSEVKAIAVGGTEYGHHTLTRFFALHAGLIPGVLIVLLMVHVALTRRQGKAEPAGYQGEGDVPYWPDQALRDAVACLAVLGTVLFLALQLRPELGPPSDPTVDFNAARPEWYFLFLFQLLKYFPGESGMFIAAQLLPGLVFLGMILMPFLGRWKLGHRFNILFLFTLLAGIVGLTADSLYEDFNGKTEKSQHFMDDLALGHSQAERAIELSSMGIPIEGAKYMLRDDPKTGGYQLFKQHCASCHDHYDTEAKTPGNRLLYLRSEEPTASNLYRFGSRQWMAGLLDPEKIVSPHFFGNTLLAEGEMVEWVKGWIGDEFDDLKAEEKKDEIKAYAEQIKTVALAISAQANLPYQREIDQRDKKLIASGFDLAIDEFGCADCHRMDAENGGFGDGPDLIGYGSHDWLVDFLRDPHTERFYYSKENYSKENDEPDRLMPGYATHPQDPSLNKLTEREIILIARYLRQDWPMPTEEETAKKPKTAESE